MVDACAWKSDKDLVPQDQIELLLSLLLEAEKRRWLASISPVNSAEHNELRPDDNQQQNYSFSDAGALLLRHGCCIDEIHSYFHRFERSHFCPKDTTNNTDPDRPSSQIKVVSNEENLDLSRSSSPRTSSAEGSITRDPGGNLSDKHPLFELYKNALLCAKYPVLSEVQPESPSTPYSPVPLPSMQQRKFSFSKPPNSSSVPTDVKVKSFSHAMSASFDDCVSPEVSLPISSEVLQELVMNVFSLNKRRQKYFSETIIPQQVPLAREPQRLLVNELRSQQLVLNRNHHPFYSVQAFMNKNTYGEWVKQEKEKIECLIRSFWHNSYPDVRSELPLCSEFHQQYVDLMERLLRFESKNKEIHPVHGGVSPTAPLSSPACKLLKEFELRYGIGLLFCKLCYLDYFVKYLENDLWYIQHVTVCLQDVMDHAFRCPEIYVEKEFKMLLSTLSDLLKKNKYSLTRIRKIFPENSPKDGVAKLVALFRLSLDSARRLQSEFSEIFSTRQMAQDFACNLPEEPFEDLLASYIKTEMDSRYERLKVIATDNLGRDFSEPQLLLNVILEIRQEVKDYSAFYKMAFSSYFDITELAVIKFYSLLMSDVEDLCANPRRTRRRNVVDPKMLGLAFRLSRLDKDPVWARFIPFSRQIWRQPFQEFALQWLESIGRFLQTLVPRLTSHDVWRAAEVNIGESQYRIRRKRQGRPIPRGPMRAKSASFLSLTPSQHSAFDTVAPSTSAPPKTNASKREVNSKRGKEPLQSRKYPLGSSPPLRTRSPNRTRHHLRGESSSDEDTPGTKRAARSKSPSKANHVHHVVAQIHPRAKADSSARGKMFKQPSHREESTMKVTNLEVNEETNNSATNLDKHKDVQEGSKMKQSLDSRDPNSFEHPSCSEQSQHALKVDDIEGVMPQPSAFSSQSGNTGERCVVQPIVIKIQQEVINKTDVSRKFTPDQSQDSAAIKTPESGFIQLPVNGFHSEDEPRSESLQELNDNENHTRPKLDQLAESREKVGGKDSVSDCSSHAQEVGDEVLLEGSLSSGRSGHDSGSGTPFENDSTDESDGVSLLHTSGYFQVPGNDGELEILQTKFNSFPGGQEEPQEAQVDPDKRKSEPNPVPEPGFISIAQDVKPVESEGISTEGQSGSDSGRTCPTKGGCVEPKKHIGWVEGSSGSDDNKQSVISTGSKGLQPRQSAPVGIPGARHKLVTRLLDTPSGSVGSTLSKCDSFVTVCSGNSTESFHTARSKNSSSRSQESGEDGFDRERLVQSGQCTGSDDRDGNSDKPQSAVQDPPKAFPVSSSFVDVICAVNRLAAFACHLCKIFCPDESLRRDKHAPAVDDESRNESLHIKKRLRAKLIEVILSFVKLYSDNVLAMETCGLPEELLAEILDERVQRHLRLLREAGRLQGCRYNPLATQCCNTRDRSGLLIPPCEGISRTQTNPGQYEPLTHKMGVRISSVAILTRILPWLSEYVTTSVYNPDSLSSTHHCFVSSTESELSHSLSYCENGPSLDGVTNNCTADPSAQTEELREPGILNGDTEHLCRLQTAQIKLVTYRINTFFKQVLQYLLDLNLPKYTIEKRLQPAMDFLSCELRRFNSVLYPDRFNDLLTDFWSAVVENFKEESHRLVRKKSSATEHSKLLSQAIAELMKFFHAGGVGLVCDELATPVDATVKHIQLYTSPTDTLISTYHSLYKQVLTMQQQYRVDEQTSSVSISSHQASANAPADFVIQALSRELHTTRKCFSGAQLVEWVKNYVRTCENGLDNLGVCIGDTETETGLELGQYLLEHGIIMCVSPPPLFNQQTPIEGRHNKPVLNSPAERGQVFISNGPSDIKINNITVTTRSGSKTSPTSTTRSSSQCTSVDESESQGEADDECEDDDEDFLGSGSNVWNRLHSALSEREATFYNHPQAFYKFVCEEDSSRTEIKLTLGINDRFNLPVKLKHILCVLYARKSSDKNARSFLRKLPRKLLNEAIDTGEDVMRYLFRVCQDCR